MNRSIKTIERDEMGVRVYKDIPVVSSRDIAEVFGKDHNHLLRDLRKAKEDMQKVAVQFWTANFIEHQYGNRGKKYPEYLLTKDGFTYIAMGFTGAKAARFKIEYITRYNAMEDYIGSRIESKSGYKPLMESVIENAPYPNKWLCPNEANMINIIVLGKRAKAFRKANGIEDPQTREYLTPQEIECISKLQTMDYTLCETGFDYQKRKQMLTQYFQTKLAPKVGLIA